MFKNRTFTLWRTVRITDHEAKASPSRRDTFALPPASTCPRAASRNPRNTASAPRRSCPTRRIRRSGWRGGLPNHRPPRAETAAAFHFQVEAGAPVSAATPRPSVVFCPRRWTTRGGGGETAPSVPSSFPSPTLAAGPELYIGGAIPLRLLTDSICFGFDWAFVS